MRFKTRVAAAILCAFVALAALALALAPQAQAATYETSQVKWVEEGQQIFAEVDGNRLTGLQVIGENAYYFDKKGVQRTGWRKVGDEFHFFKIANGEKGYMVCDKVVNTITIDEEGNAIQNDGTLEELDILLKANKLMDTLAKPCMSKEEKLRAAWDYMEDRSKVAEKPYRKFKNKRNWHHEFALDVFDRHGGSCYSMGAAFAYLGNAIGFKTCEAIASGPHGWARIDGLVYDPEWSPWHKGEFYAVKDKKGTQNYAAASNYIAKISPNSKPCSTKASIKGRGLVKKGGCLYYFGKSGKKAVSKWKKVGRYSYYFDATGKAVTGCVEIDGKWWVFDGKGRLSTGKELHDLAIDGVEYLVNKDGSAYAGWDATNTYCYAKGLPLTGVCVIDDRFCAFDSETGVYDEALSMALRGVSLLEWDVSALKRLMGYPLNALYMDACRPGPGGLAGEDGILEYGSVILYTFRDVNGLETLSGFEAK